MASDRLDVVGVGNAIVDVIAQADEAFLAAHSIPKGGMILIDEAQAQEIYAAMAPGVEIQAAGREFDCMPRLARRRRRLYRQSRRRCARKNFSP